ncbi:hypothetical protein T4A_2416, partial [Trichinella pseudospiralis]
LCNDSLQETDESNIRCGRESEKFLPPQILTTYGLITNIGINDMYITKQEAKSYCP